VAPTLVNPNKGRWSEMVYGFAAPETLVVYDR
jgi:hypothetical protein